ncbi:pilus assembly protein PilM [Burkholderia gladioli]|uniref:pilus assembly protein PilM n=1 Tax=Burkholderia gladioli TaxID=28095 RepID=UPI00163EF4FC|nr:pilus assembly protein PilM [Burkholderia gladioli]
MRGRRVAAGIDVGRDAVRVAFVSRCGNALGIEALEVEPFTAPYDVTSADWSEVTRALETISQRVRGRLPVRGMAAAMALSYREVVMSTLDPVVARHGALEQAVYAEAERSTGMPRDSLAIDWCVNDILYPGRLVIASTDQARIDLRVDAVAAAGFMLTGIDGEPHAALRAIRQVAVAETEPDEPYVAIWIGEGSVDAWRVEGMTVATHLSAPSVSHANLAELMRDLAGRGLAECAFVGGNFAMAGDMPPAMFAEIADPLGCLVLPFECAPYCRNPHIDAAARHSPVLAVAFGLALRGVYE